MAEIVFQKPKENIELYKSTLAEHSVDVTIGEEKSAAFVPKITLSKWAGAGLLGISLDKSFTAKSTLVSSENAAKETQSALTVEDNDVGFYVLPYDSDVLKFGLILKTKPATNTFSFQLEGYEQFNIFRIPSYYKDGVSTNAQAAGGFALKHKTNANPDFGMFLPIIFIDANGWKITPKFSIINGVYKIEIPQDYLDKAVYPIKANDTYVGAYAGTVTCNCTQGDLIIAAFSGGGVYNGATRATITDENSNTYTEIVNDWHNFGGSHNTAILISWAVASVTNTANTVTLNAVDDYDPGGSVHCYTGMNTTTPVDSSLFGYGDDASSYESSALSVAANAGWLFSFWAQVYAVITVTGTNGWTKRTEQTGHVHASCDKSFASSGSYTASVSLSGACDYAWGFVALKAATTGSASASPIESDQVMIFFM